MEAATSYTRDELEDKKYSELQKISKALGIKGGRLKTDKLIEAILEVGVPDSLSEDAGNIATALAEAAVKEEEDSLEEQDVKATDSLDLLADCDFPDDDLLGGLEPTPVKTPGRRTKNGLTVATPTPQSSMKKRVRPETLEDGNEATPDALSNSSKRRRTATFEVDDEISFPNIPCQDDDEISFPKIMPSEKEEKVAENTQLLACLVSQLPSLTPAQVSKRRRGRGRKPVLAAKMENAKETSQVIQDTNTMDIQMLPLRREGTFDKEPSDLSGSEGNNSDIKDQSIVREGTYVKDEENVTLERENTFTKDKPESGESTEKLGNNDFETASVAIDDDDDIVTSDHVTEFVADTEESNLPIDDIITSDNVTEFVVQPTETPEKAVSQSENTSFKSQLSVKKSRSSISMPSSARKSFASGTTPGLNRKSINISRKSIATPLKSNNVRKSIGIMGIHVADIKKVAGSRTPVGAKILTPVTKKSLVRKSIGTPLVKIVTPVTKINSGRKSIGTPLVGRKTVSRINQLGDNSTSNEKPIETAINKTSTFATKLMKPTFTIGQTNTTKTDQTKKQTGSGIPRFLSYARKMKMPDFTKIHEKAFKKMEALDDYADKRKRTRTITAGGGNGTPKATTPATAAVQVQVFTPSVTNVKNLNLNFTESVKKKTPNNSKSPKTVKKTPTNLKLVTLGNKTSSKKINNSSKPVTKSPNVAGGKAKKSPKIISTKSPKMSIKSPQTSGKSTKTSKPQSGKKEVPRSGIPTLKENSKPDSKSSSSLLESKIPAPKIKLPSPKNTFTSVAPTKPLGYRPYTGSLKPLHQRNTKEDLKNMAMRNPKVKSSLQIRAGQRTILKGVRINKRFELQMANRGFDLNEDK